MASPDAPEQLEALRAQLEESQQQLTALQAEKQQLVDQVKRLVKTEAHLYDTQERLDHQIRLYRQLYELGKRFNAAVAVDEVLQVAVQFVIYELNFARAIILWRTRDERIFRVQRMEGYYDQPESREIEGLALPEAEAALGPLWAGAEQIICPAGCGEPRLEQLGRRLGVSEYLLLPLGGLPREPAG